MSLDLLTGPDAGELLAAAVASAGGSLLDWVPQQVDHRPGRGTTVAYRAQVSWPGGVRTETLGASSREDDGPPPPSPGLIALSDGTTQVGVWCLPYDPDLPALARALDPGELLASLGVAGRSVSTAVVSYRPRRRAVVRVDAGAVRLYLKVLARGADVEPLHRRHVLLHEAGVPVPRSLGWSDDGLLALEGLPGTGLRAVLRADGEIPSGAAVLEVLSRFPAAVADLPRRTPWAELAPRYAASIAAVLPEEGLRVVDLAGSVSAGLHGCAPGSEPTHGDLYEGQLTVAGGRVVGLLDVDTAGPGRRVDDLSNALGHLEALALADPPSAERARATARAWEVAFGAAGDRDELRLRTAGVLIGLATGPHRTQAADWPAATVAHLDAVEALLSPRV
ncbi:phosphotransferase [Spongisporangium articulatum]|uniref:Phosphotransferase n=1 Tax=Spongisporangium articulatum TaxID=3362603 RepID=A0ABW8AI78_9ACTN